MYEKIIGIDLGTTNSCVAVAEGQQLVVIPNKHGERLTPSVVRIRRTGEAEVGSNALSAISVDPGNTICGVKRLLGRRYNEIFDLASLMPYDLIAGDEDVPEYRCHGKVYTPHEISAQIISYLKDSAEAYLGATVRKAVVTVPAYFGKSQRQATREAAEIAGLEVARIISEPTAAAMAYKSRMTRVKKYSEYKLVVFDLGGGTLDISVVELCDDDAFAVIEVISTAGDNFLGGDDFDILLTDWIADELNYSYGIDADLEPSALELVRKAANSAKCSLSEFTEVDIDFHQLELLFDVRDIDGLSLTRNELNLICEELFERMKLPCERALQDANLAASDIDNVILIGGATRMRRVHDLIHSLFSKEPLQGINPDEAVALGAALQASVLAGETKTVLLLDVTSLMLGVEDAEGNIVPIIDKDTSIPTEKKVTFTTAFEDQESVSVTVVEGEPQSKSPERFRKLATLTLDGITEKSVEIEVKFDVDQNGILVVSVRDRASGNENSVRVTPSTGFSPAKIARVKKSLADRTFT